MNTINTQIRLIAIAAARIWHEGQKYGEEDYVDAHLIPVAEKAETLFMRHSEGNGLSEEEREEYATNHFLMGVFHDTIEDGKASVDEIWRFLSRVIPLDRALKIAARVNALKRSDRELYLEYIARLIAAGGDALRVKQADLEVNLENNPSESLRSRYKKAIKMIETTEMEGAGSNG